MPRLYVTPAELAEMPLGLAFTAQLAQFGTGVADKLLARASQRCDNFVEKRLQSPGSTTLSQSASATTSIIAVASTTTLDNLAEQAVIIDLGNANQETLLVQPGGVSVATWTSPYPGTIQLSSSLMFGHTSGAPVQFAYKETNEAGKASQSDPYSEALQSQAAQLALAHLPAMHVGLTRITFLNSYPIQNIITVEHSYSFDTNYNLIYDSANPVFTGGIVVDPVAGYFRYRVGTVVTPEGFVRTTYVGGYQVIPDDIKIACSYYFAEEIKQMINPYNVRSESQGKRSLSWDPMHTNVDEAERILKRYKRSV